LSDQQIIDAWNAMLLDFPEERITLLQELGKKYPLYLLSNTNSIHLSEFTDRLKAVHGIASLNSLFHKTYYSHLIGYRKPDIAIYEHVIRENNLDAAATLFIDDTLLNVEGARRAGLQARLLMPAQTIADLF